MSALPHPRAELVVRDADGGGLIVHDPITGHRTHLGEESAAVYIARAAGHDTPAGLCAAVPTLSPATVRDRLRQIGDALLLDDGRWAAQRALFEGAPTPAPTPTETTVNLDPALRHRCIRCGSSCLNVDIGPVPDASLHAIEAHRLYRGEAESAAELVETRITVDGPVRVFDHVAGACVMLDDDACALHAAAGPEAKPPGCRQFPYTLTRTPDGVDVGLQLECKSLGAALAAGAAVDGEAHAAGLAALVEGGAVATLPAAVALGPGVFVSARRYLDWHRAHRHAPLAEVVAAAAKLTEARLGELAGTRPWLDGWPASSTVDVGLLREALPSQIASACAWITREAAQRGGLVEQEQAELVRKAALIDHGAVRLPPTHFVDGALDAERVALLGALADHRAVIDYDLMQGLGRIVIWLRCARALARLRAAQAGRRPVHGQDVNDALVVTHRMLRTAPLDHTLRAAHAAVRAALVTGDAPPAWIGVPAPHLVG